MTPQTAIGLLDRAIARNGETVTVRRNVEGGAPVEQTLQAFCRGYHADELTDDIQVNDSMGIVSPTGLAWPPQRYDDAVVAGRTRKVQNVDAIRVQDIVVRYEMQVR